ncbi:diaminopimelate epimerase [Caldanaerobius polysaccharolyticus]|uniref:diaminopimelate epimerase n=1 Tax=Caldanaerobius polysaccharolyticus TaxID=44256 RepID=UPI00047E3D54|nr:diaminopimelate epimerase [Caldanaerobius polysaccharolyticus]
MKFTKMQGTGNDFVVVQETEIEGTKDYAAMARRLCDRHFGIGADGLIVVCRSEVADIKMRIFNADGSEAEMCGNGIRCFSKYVYERNVLNKDKFRVETLAGVVVPMLEVENGMVKSVTVNMGNPVFDDTLIDFKLDVKDRSFYITYVNMGVPHVVIFVDDILVDDIVEYGPLIERHKLFPQGTNVNFVKVVSRDSLWVRTWERGVGLTLACGTGTCASAVAACRSGKVERRVTAHLAGGDLGVEWMDDGCVYMSGPAEIIFDGIVKLA